MVEAVLAALGLYLFIAHMFTAEHPFIEPGLFRNRNFSVGLVFIFIIGVMLFKLPGARGAEGAGRV